MSLRHALLGMLSVGPMTGYDLIDYFDRTASLVWAASQAQIYPELRQMEADGLLTAKVASRGVHGRKRISSVTRKGTSELRRWAGDPIVYPPIRDPVRLKISYVDSHQLPKHARTSKVTWPTISRARNRPRSNSRTSRPA